MVERKRAWWLGVLAAMTCAACAQESDHGPGPGSQAASAEATGDASVEHPPDRMEVIADAATSPATGAAPASHDLAATQTDAAAIAPDSGTPTLADDAAVHDAGSAAEAACGTAKPWSGPQAIMDVAPVRGHDGFFVLLGDPQSAGSSSSTTGLFAEDGTLITLVTTGQEPPVKPACTDCPRPWALRAVSQGETLAATVYVPLDGVSWRSGTATFEQDQGEYLLISGQPARQTAFGFYNRNVSVYTALRSTGEVILAHHSQRNGDGNRNDLVDVIDVSVRDSSGGDPWDSRIDTMGHILVDLLVDGRDRVIALQQRWKGTDPPTAAAARVSVLEQSAFDRTLALGQSWTTPDDVMLYAMAYDAGKIAVVGKSATAPGSPGYVQLLDAASLQPIWSAPTVLPELGLATAAGFAADGDLVVGGLNGLMRLSGDDGTPRWAQPAEGFIDITALQVQSDGKVFGTGRTPADDPGTERAFVFCE